MELASTREKIHSLIDTTSKDKLQEIYHLLDNEEEYTDDFKAELDAEYEDYQKNNDVVPREEVDLLIEQLLHRQKINIPYK